MSDDDMGESIKPRGLVHRGGEDDYTRDQTPDGRIRDDLNVADLYMKDWNYRGAYLRYQDALQMDSFNEAAIFGLGKSACMQNMAAQAVAEMKDYLNLYPSGKSAKEAKKILSDPKKCTGNH